MRGLAVMLLLGAAGCGQSIDAKFAMVCEDAKTQVAGVKEASEKMCRYGDYLTQEQKAEAIASWEELKEAEARVNAIEEEGRRKGYE